MLDRIHYISQGVDVKSQLESIKNALDAGCKLIQLRFKNRQEIMPLAKQVKEQCDANNALLIINDFVDVAKEIDAAGVHLGLNDTSVLEARLKLGANKIIGGTANTLEDVKQRIAEQCDYIGLGPFRFTTTKENLSPILGLEGYKSIINQLEKAPVIYAIGGIELEDVESLMEVGIYGIAISGLLTYHSDKKKLVNELNTIFNGYVKNSR